MGIKRTHKDRRINLFSNFEGICIVPMRKLVILYFFGKKKKKVKQKKNFLIITKVRVRVTCGIN